MSKKTKLGQAGMVSIMITMIMMIVITLIVVGFSSVARRNQREALDRQLSNQAFYAAETGVNDVLKLSGPIVNVNSNQCTGPNSVIVGNTLHASIDPANKVSYTCVLVSDKLRTITESVPLGGDKVVQVDPTDAVSGNPTPTDLTISWQSSNPANGSAATCPTSGIINSFPPQTKWIAPILSGGFNCPFGILRFDLFDSSSNPTGPTAIANATEVFYIVPHLSLTSPPALPTPTSISINGGAQLIQANCNSGTCWATLKTSALAGTKYYARMSGLYEDLGNVTIDGGPNNKFINAGLMIDATGQAQDQLKRIQVRVKSTNSSGINIPSSALSSAGQICKRFTIEGSGTSASPDWNSATPLCGP